MSTFSPIMAQAYHAPDRAAACGDGRPGRVMGLLPVIWALNMVDLLFTLLAGTTRDFVELNPVATHLSAPGQVAYKLAMLMFCTIIFIWARQRRAALLGSYLLLGVYGTLAAVWLTMFPFLLSPIYLRQLTGLF